MTISVYVDGSGGPNGGYGYFVKESGESFYEKKPEITNVITSYSIHYTKLYDCISKQ